MSRPTTGLRLAGAPNTRGLDGHPGTDGCTVRPGLVIRSQSLTGLTDTDVAVLADLPLRTVVDYRGPGEIVITGEDRLPSTFATGAEPPGSDRRGSQRIDMPVFAADHDIYTTLAALPHATDPSQVSDALGDGGATRIMLDMYRWFVADPAARLPFARTLRLLADADRLPLLYHCTAGKDRTGWMTAILLTVLGVDRDRIVDDYLISNRHPLVRVEDLVPQVPELDPEMIRPLIEVRTEYLDAAFGQVDRDYGGMSGFVELGLGIDPATLNRLTHNLLAR